ncbi:MAG: 50S ribosomal protein L1 [bacterium]
MKRGKKYNEAAKLIEADKLYAFDESIELVKKTGRAKFDETVEMSLKLGIDPKQSNQLVRGTVILPNGIGKTPKIAVIAKGEKLKEAEASGADIVGADDLIEKIQKGFLDFDVLVATPDMMRDLSKLGKILGPKGLMPNPKIGTVTFEIKNAVEEIKKGKIEYKADSYGIVHAILGKVSFDVPKLRENASVLLQAVVKAKPSSVKGDYIHSITVSTTMGPGIRINVQQALSATKK